MKTSKKAIAEYVRLGLAEDITRYPFDKMSAFLREHTLEKVSYSTGVYGLNSGLLRDVNTGDLYAITARTNALFMVF